jgi:DNA polymerase-3 subunit gamma/tau
MAVEQAVPGALDADDPDAEAARRLAGALAPDETQLLYSIVLHGRDELALMSDEYGALTMVLLRMLAFPPAGGGAPVRVDRPPRAEPKAAPPAPAPAPAEARVAALRTPAPPAIALAVVPPAAPAQPAAPAPASALGDRWHRIVTKLGEQGAIVALARELACQAGLVGVDDAAAPPVWRLRVERETLRAPALADKLASALAAELGAPVALVVEAGVPEDTPAKRDAAERARRQAQAEETIRTDPVVVALMGQFKTARIVPGSVKPV